MNPLIQSKNITILAVFIALTLGCFGLSPQARAVCQEGCLTNSNTALGEDALINNTTGDTNTAIGSGALTSNTTGNNNTATGVFALASNTTGNFNTAIGYIALDVNSTGSGNTATGYAALNNNNSGSNNTATGYYALVSSQGSNNTATGNSALLSNITGSNNIALGFQAGINHAFGSNNIYIGSFGALNESRTIRIGAPSTHGRTFLSGISGVTVAEGVGVIVDTNGQLGTVVSSERFKDGIKPMDKASEAILALKPVTFRYKHELDSKGIPQFGLVAEDVEKVNPALVARDSEGEVYTVRYEAVNAMLLNEFLKEHRKVEEQEASITQLKSTVAKQEATIAQQQRGMDAVTARLNEQAAQIQKVSAQLEASKPAPQVVNNP
jgi:uncharacterized coiled-coil protein SlyX